MAELFKKFLGASSEAPLNGFDLSARDVYSTKVGLENPVKSIFTIPRGEYSIDVKSLVRSAQPLQTTAFTRFDMQYEFYRVHINDLYSSFNQKIAMREDEQVSLHPDFSDGFPCFPLADFMKALIYVAVYDYFVEHDFHTTVDGYDVHVWASTCLDEDNNVVPRTEAYYAVALNQPFDSLALNVVRALDMFGYGNVLPIVKQHFKTFKYYIENVKFSGYHPTQNTAYKISFTDLLNSLGDATHELPDGNSYKQEYDLAYAGLPSDLYCNLWLPLAYNKIFSEEYRNPYYDFEYSVRDNVFGYTHVFPYVKLFNLDDQVEFEIEYSGDEYSDDFWRLLAIFALKYRPYGKDMFNGVLPSTQFGDISVMTTDNEYYEIIAKTNSSSTKNMEISGTSGRATNGITTGVYNTQYRFNPAIAISVLEQRRADALQKFNENRLRAGNRTASNFIAHFGVAPKSEPHHSVMFLGSFDGSIELNQVASTNTSENNQLGQLVSNGVGVVQGNKIRYKTDDFDIIMCLQSISKPSEYDAYGLDRELQILDPWDYPYSELQNISLKPIDRITYNVFSNDMPRVLGYEPAFIEKKTAVDKVHGEFYSGLPYSVPTLNSFLKIPSGLFSSYVTPRDNTYLPQSIAFLYISPDSVDNVFEAAANGSQETDQFICNTLFDIKAVQPLSVLGLPK